MYSRVPVLTGRIAGVIGVLLTLAGASGRAQNTNIAIGATVLQTSVKRLGINLGLQTFYDSGQMTKNLISRNPGFEGGIFQSAIRCISGTVNTCVDDDSYSGWPSGFWNGATVEIFYGRAAGRKETVAFYTTATSGKSGGTFTFVGSGTAPAVGDYMIVRKVIPGDATAGWSPYTTGAATISTNTTDLPPGTAGLQTVVIKSPGATDLASLSSYFDSTAGKTFVTMRGSFQVKFKAKGTGGSNSVVVSVQRTGIPAYLYQTVQLTGSWDTYTLNFDAGENGSIPGTVVVRFSTNGPDAFLLDDASLTQVDSDSTNTTAFRDAVVDTLKTLSPGVLRFWSTQLGDSLDNLIAPQFGRQRSGYSAFSNLQDDISYGLHEFLELSEAVGAEAWVVIPITFTPVEAANLIEYLAGKETTPYGAKRAALGHPGAWTTTLAKIHLEFGNESWNGGFKGGVIEYSQPYGQRAQSIFAAMKSSKSYVASRFDLVLGGQAVFASRNQDIQNNCNNNDTFAVGPYMMGTVDSYATNENLYGSTFAEPEALWSAGAAAEGITGGYMLQNQRALQASSHPVPMAIYETNMGTTQGSITQAALNAYAPSLGAGLAVASHMLQHMRQGVLTQNLFSLPQYQFLRPDGKTVPLWGSVVDMGVTDRKRPQFLAMQLANQAIGGRSSSVLSTEASVARRPVASHRVAMLETVHSGGDPVWNQPLVNTVQLNGAHYLQSFAFSDGAEHSIVIFNLHRSSPLPVTFSGVNAPLGTVVMDRLTSAQPGDNNEDSNKVSITTQTLDRFVAANAISLPPYSMTILRWRAISGAVHQPLVNLVEEDK